MGKCFDNFEELVDYMRNEMENGRANGKAMEVSYIGACAGYLAHIVDRLDEIASKLEEKKGEEK